MYTTRANRKSRFLHVVGSPRGTTGHFFARGVGGTREVVWYKEYLASRATNGKSLLKLAAMAGSFGRTYYIRIILVRNFCANV